MRIVNWNVNSARTRVDRMVDFLLRHDVDVLAVQETKCKDEQFPTERFTEIGYEVAHFGLNQWNGVAIISRVGIENVETHFPAQPGFNKDITKEQSIEARAIGARCGGVQVWSLYVPNGREIADPHYDYKLRWLFSLRNYVIDTLEYRPEEKLVLLGDFNIAPTDIDVWDIAASKEKPTSPNQNVQLSTASSKPDSKKPPPDLVPTPTGITKAHASSKAKACASISSSHPRPLLQPRVKPLWTLKNAAEPAPLTTHQSSLITRCNCV